MTARFIPYYRVSTKRQGESGLGLEAQQVDVKKLVAEGEGDEIAVYTEIETGKSPDRPELAKAIQHSKMANATLVVAKLDRWPGMWPSGGLSGVRRPVYLCDCKEANRFTVHILAAVAEEEARKISERTKKALAAAKARGVQLGSKQPGRWTGKQNGWAAAQTKSVVSRQNRRRKLTRTCCRP